MECRGYGNTRLQMSKQVIEYFTNTPLQYCKHTLAIIDKIMYDRWVKEEIPKLIAEARKENR